MTNHTKTRWGSLSHSLKIPFRPLVATLAMAASLPAFGLDVNYRYIRFKPITVSNGGSAVQISEFTFAYQGNTLNLNGINGSGTPVPVTVSSGTQDPAAAEGPGKILDGNTATKWFRPEATVSGNELIFDFTDTPPTFDSYNFANGNDNEIYNRTPISWSLAGSSDGTNWIPLDIRNNAAVVTTNFAFQAGFDVPEVIPAIIDYFGVYNTGATGSSVVVINGQSTKLAWETGNASTVNLTGPDQVPVNVPLSAADGYTITPPNSSTSTYTLQANPVTGDPVTASTSVRAVVGGASTFRYVRYTVLKRIGGGVPGEAQLSEFQFYNGSTQVPVSEVTNIGGSNGDPSSTSNERAIFLIDGDTNTKWYDSNSAPVIFDFGSPQTFDRYRFFTANDSPYRDPNQWTLEGSDDQTTWTLIENMDFDFPVPGQRFTSSQDIPLPGPSITPRIMEFSASSSQIIEGDSTTLTYRVGGATSLTLNGELLPGTSGQIEVTPVVDTTYTLVVATAGSENALTVSLDVIVFADPEVDSIDYTDFSSAGEELRFAGTAALEGNRLRLTPDEIGQAGSAFFYKKLNGTAGFEITFDLKMNIETPVVLPPADGIAVVIHNATGGTGNVGNGELGVSENALNIMFRSFDINDETFSSSVQVLSGSTPLSEYVSIYETPGTEIVGIPAVLNAEGEVVAGGYPYTLATLDTEPAYSIRIVYVPGDLDVYFDGIAVIQNVDVNLEDIGATDASGGSYFGFTARTGLYTENNDILNWKVQFGDFTEEHDFAMIKTIYKPSLNPEDPEQPSIYDLVWYANEGKTYSVEYSNDLVNWSEFASLPGLNGQLGYDFPMEPDVPKEFYRIVELDNVPAE